MLRGMNRREIVQGVLAAAAFPAVVTPEQARRAGSMAVGGHPFSGVPCRYVFQDHLYLHVRCVASEPGMRIGSPQSLDVLNAHVARARDAGWFVTERTFSCEERPKFSVRRHMLASDAEAALRSMVNATVDVPSPFPELPFVQQVTIATDAAWPFGATWIDRVQRLQREWDPAMDDRLRGYSDRVTS